MFLDLFFKRVQNASEDELRNLLSGILIDLEATDNADATAADIRECMYSNFSIYLSR